MTQVLNYIVNDDGYTDRTYIKGIDRLTTDVRLEFRPVLPEDRIRILVAVRDEDDPVEGEQMLMDAIASYITVWDIKDKDGKTLPITGDTVFSLREPLRDRIVSIVFYGRDPGDRDPKGPFAKESKKKSTDQVKAIIDRNKPSSQRQVDDAKN